MSLHEKGDNMAVATDRVSRRDGVKSGRPTVRDSKISVLQVLDLVRDGDVTPAMVAEQYPDVPSARAVEDALAWADDHPQEIARLRRERESARDDLSEIAADV
jgi:uncharacterized protein (DUF433 family)